MTYTIANCFQILPIMQSVSQFLFLFPVKEYLENQRESLGRPNTVNVSETKNALPQYIYLKKGEAYNFTVTMTLESGQPNRKYRVFSCNILIKVDPYTCNTLRYLKHCRNSFK
jgi:hypothetical protein